MLDPFNWQAQDVCKAIQNNQQLTLKPLKIAIRILVQRKEMALFFRGRWEASYKSLETIAVNCQYLSGKLLLRTMIAYRGLKKQNWTQHINSYRTFSTQGHDK